VHGIDDDVVPASQSINLARQIIQYAIANKIDPKCDLKLYKREGHTVLSQGDVQRDIAKEAERFGL
jgi:dipeptidyl aminopeptidase/acylaminoacyl peptidase